MSYLPLRQRSRSKSESKERIKRNKVSNSLKNIKSRVVFNLICDKNFWPIKIFKICFRVYQQKKKQIIKKEVAQILILIKTISQSTMRNKFIVHQLHRFYLVVDLPQNLFLLLINKEVKFKKKWKWVKKGVSEKKQN